MNAFNFKDVLTEITQILECLLEEETLLHKPGLIFSHCYATYNQSSLKTVTVCIIHQLYYLAKLVILKKTQGFLEI